ncbi:MAG: RAMP superfamily CRISPR-associated protein [Ignavibacteria bacterium]|nr:RAMP superfamily CRISPR-associated protein [Ignavibacteria bacterium]
MNKGKLILEGEIELLSPLHIGSGDNDSTDLDIIKDNEGRPFITFTSFIGALKNHIQKNYNVVTTDTDVLFGLSDDIDSRGSIIMGTDLYLTDESKPLITTRDGIKIELPNGMVEKGAKYDYEIVDCGIKFSFMLEAAYSSDSFSKEKLLQYYSTVVDSLKNDDGLNKQPGLRLGAKTNNGLGRIRIVNEKLYDYDFAEMQNVIAWLKREKGKEIEIIPPFEINEDDFIIDAYLDLKTSLIQRSYNDDPKLPDSTHIQSNKKDILTGSGTKGAIAARAKKIINTIWNEKREIEKNEFCIKLFGDVNTKDKTKKAVKGKLQIEERELPEYVAELQTRIKIDRFTGGTITGALFDSMPLFNSKKAMQQTELKNKYTRLTIRVKKCTEAEAGLMLLVLKDIWTGDLAIGGEKGIGRGVFNGFSASIKYHKETIELTVGLENLEKLQKYVDALIINAGGKNGNK